MGTARPVPRSRLTALLAWGIFACGAALCCLRADAAHESIQREVLLFPEEQLIREGFVEDHDNELDSPLDGIIEIDNSVNPRVKTAIQLHEPTVLHVAICGARIRLVQHITAKIASRRGRNVLQSQVLTVTGRFHLQGVPPLTLAVLCKAGSATLAALVETGGHEPGAPDASHRMDALAVAAELGELDAVRALVKLGAPLTMKARSHLRVHLHPIHLAAVNNHVDVLRFLVSEAGVPVDLQAYGDGDTALHVAAQYGHLQLAFVLVQELRAAFELSNAQDQQTPLLLSVAWKRPALEAYFRALYAAAGKEVPPAPPAEVAQRDTRNFPLHAAEASAAAAVAAAAAAAQKDEL